MAHFSSKDQNLGANGLELFISQQTILSIKKRMLSLVAGAESNHVVKMENIGVAQILESSVSEQNKMKLLVERASSQLRIVE